MMQLKTGEMLIVAARGIRIKTALPVYRNRWGIETLFSAMKTRGLGLGNMHITAPQTGDVDERVGNRILPRLQNRPLA